MQIVINILEASLDLLLDSSPYMLLGILVGGLVKVYLNPASVARHLGQGRFMSVFKAALLGVPLPLCSCGVLPAAASLKRQGANNGATASFLISTPESGVDSMAATYALLDPIMTLARPLAAFATALAAGISENLISPPEKRSITPDLSCPVDGCCDGVGCDPADHARHHTWPEKARAGLHYAVTDLWADLAAWFLAGILLAGAITALAPTEFLSEYLGGGIGSMLIMLAVGVPMYICATASTPIAAALILKGVSPGAALVFLLAGPATNLTSLTMLTGILGKRATAVYLASIAVFALVWGLLLDRVYAWLGVSAVAVAGRAAEALPPWVQWVSMALLLAISVGPVWRSLRRILSGKAGDAPASAEGAPAASRSCGCGSCHAAAPAPIGIELPENRN